MLTLNVQTKLKPLEALESAYKYFTVQVGLKVVEIVAHLHAQDGFTEIRVSSGKIIAKREYDAQEMLNDLVRYVERSYGLQAVHYLLHMHSIPDETAGHMVVKVNTSTPTELELTSEDYDHQAQEYANRLPKAG